MEKQQPDTHHRNLSLWDMSFALVILGFGFGLATFAFTVEILCNQWISIIKAVQNLNLKLIKLIIRKMQLIKKVVTRLRRNSQH